MKIVTSEIRTGRFAPHTAIAVPIADERLEMYRKKLEVYMGKDQTVQDVIDLLIEHLDEVVGDMTIAEAASSIYGGIEGLDERIEAAGGEKAEYDEMIEFYRPK